MYDWRTHYGIITIKKDSTKFDLLPVYGTVCIKHIRRYYNILIFKNHKLVV